MTTVQVIDLITTDPAVRGGRPCIGGTGLRVIDIVMANLFHHRAPNEVASDYDLTLAQVHAALAFYYSHKLELDEDIRRQVDRVRTLKEQHTQYGD